MRFQSSRTSFTSLSRIRAGDACRKQKEKVSKSLQIPQICQEINIETNITEAIIIKDIIKDICEDIQIIIF